MSVTGPSANITAIERLSEHELQQGIIGEASWHHRYKDSCYIYVGGLDKRMTEGDIIIVFSQFGEPIDINLKRDKKTGASLGYCFLGYKDQRSTILAVDNFNGSTLLGRRIRVDHVLDYKAPVLYEDEVDDEGNKIRKDYKPTGAEGQGIDAYYVTNTEAILKEAYQSRQKPDVKDDLDEDERWALEFEKSLKKESDPNAKQDEDRRSGSPRRSRRSHSRDRDRHRHHRRRSRSHSRRRHRSHSKDRHHSSKHRHRSSERRHKRRSHSR